MALENKHPNPAPDWLTDKSWAEIVRCSVLPAFEGLKKHFERNVSTNYICRGECYRVIYIRELLF